MRKYKFVFFSPLALILIFVCASCGLTKDIYIGYEYPNFVKEEPVEIKVGQEIRFVQYDDYGYMIVIENANEFLDIDSENLTIAVTNSNYFSKHYLVDKKGTGDYFLKVLCLEKARYNEVPSRIIIKSE